MNVGSYRDITDDPGIELTIFEIDSKLAMAVFSPRVQHHAAL
jgi:hypothetical protein